MDTTEDLNLTASQERTLEELKRKMSGELDEEYRTFDETYLFYRFLKARDWDASNAEHMLKKCLQRRKQQNFLRDYTPTEFLKTYFDKFHIGYDKEECPVIYAPTGKVDVKGLHKSARINDIEKYLYQLFSFHEKYLERKSKENNRRLHGFLIICNAGGLTFANAVNKFGFEVLTRINKLQDHFPERLKALYVINANSYFKFSYDVVKNFLTMRTQSKLNVYGADGWQEELLKRIDADQLPAFMGGTRADPDGNPLCKTLINQGGLIDESYYIPKSASPLSSCPGAKQLRISRLSTARVPLGLKEAGSVIEWEFETKSGDIGFGLSYQDCEKQVTEVVPLERVSTKDFCESGIYKCENGGDYFILFDNSYSWFWSKEVFYRIKVLEPNELQDTT